MVTRECGSKQLHHRVLIVAFYGRDLTTFTCHSEGNTGSRWLAVDKDRAGTADTMLAAEVRSRQLQFVSHEVTEVHPWLGFAAESLAVDSYGYGFQVFSP
jgi:hypothetical protein